MGIKTKLQYLVYNIELIDHEYKIHNNIKDMSKSVCNFG